MEDKVKKDGSYSQSREDYVNNTVRAMRDMYSAEGKEFNEEEARANAERDWEANQSSEESAPENKGVTVRSDVPKEEGADDRRGRIRNALSSVLNGDAFKQRIGRK